MEVARAERAKFQRRDVSTEFQSKKIGCTGGILLPEVPEKLHFAAARAQVSPSSPPAVRFRSVGGLLSNGLVSSRVASLRFYREKQHRGTARCRVPRFSTHDLAIVIDRYRAGETGQEGWSLVASRKNGDKNAMHNPSGRDERSARGCDAPEQVARRAGEEARTVRTREKRQWARGDGWQNTVREGGGGEGRKDERKKESEEGDENPRSINETRGFGVMYPRIG